MSLLDTEVINLSTTEKIQTFKSMTMNVIDKNYTRLDFTVFYKYYR